MAAAFSTGGVIAAGCSVCYDSTSPWRTWDGRGAWTEAPLTRDDRRATGDRRQDQTETPRHRHRRSLALALAQAQAQARHGARTHDSHSLSPSARAPNPNGPWRRWPPAAVASALRSETKQGPPDVLLRCVYTVHGIYCLSIHTQCPCIALKNRTRAVSDRHRFPNIHMGTVSNMMNMCSPPIVENTCNGPMLEIHELMK